jgi:hypothetical protein
LRATKEAHTALGDNALIAWVVFIKTWFYSSQNYTKYGREYVFLKYVSEKRAPLALVFCLAAPLPVGAIHFRFYRGY